MVSSPFEIVLPFPKKIFRRPLSETSKVFITFVRLLLCKNHAQYSKVHLQVHVVHDRVQREVHL